MKHAKTIKLFLMDGDSRGRLACELSNWSGKAYKIPRVDIKKCTDREELTRTGVYLLFGRDDLNKDQVYIGEAENILKRLNQQLNNKEFWNEAIIFISKDDNLNKAHIKYLENRLHDIAKSANRYKVDNSVIPTQASISEADKAEMEEFIEYIQILVNTLGHKVFEEKRENQLRKEQNIFYINAARGAEGRGEPTTEGFVVLKGSKAAASVVNSISTAFITLRQRLVEEGVLADRTTFLEFTDDYVFGSPSTAAAVLMGRNANGLTEWKDSLGKTLKEYENIKNI